MKTIQDDYQEHELHQRPYWKTMKTCSSCFSQHKRIVKEGAISKGGFRTYDNITRNPELE